MKMIGPTQESIRCAPPSAPASGAAVNLFHSINAFGAKQMRTLGVDMIEVTFLNISHASGTSGFKAYTSTDGSTWVENDMKDDGGTATMPVTVGATEDPKTFRFVTSPFDDFKLEYTNSAATLTAWSITVVAHTYALAVQR